MNPHLVEDGYNGVECDPADPSASLRHYFGTDIRAAIVESGHFNGRTRDLEFVHTIVAAAVDRFGEVREVYPRDRDREVTASFGDRVENRLWISTGRIGTRGQVHELQFVDRTDMDLWRVELSDRARSTASRRPTTPPRRVCTACFMSLPLTSVRECPSCGAPISGLA